MVFVNAVDGSPTWLRAPSAPAPSVRYPAARSHAAACAHTSQSRTSWKSCWWSTSSTGRRQEDQFPEQAFLQSRTANDADVVVAAALRNVKTEREVFGSSPQMAARHRSLTAATARSAASPAEQPGSRVPRTTASSPRTAICGWLASGAGVPLPQAFSARCHRARPLQRRGSGPTPPPHLNDSGRHQVPGAPGKTGAAIASASGRT